MPSYSIAEKKESVWDLAVKINSRTQQIIVPEKTLIFVGSKGSVSFVLDEGKSTIIQKFLDRNEIIKETLALEYNFGRKSGRSFLKETCHIWELGGGTLFINLLGLHLGGDNKTLILVLDLSAPEQLWSDMETILTYVYNHHEKKKETANFVQDKMKQPEEFMIMFPMHLVIVGGKYDVFKNFDLEKKKQICHTLRSVALLLSATLIFYSDKDTALAKKLMDILHFHGFGGSQWKGHCTDFDKPLLICAGSDSFESLGINKDSLSRKIRGISSLEVFKHTYTVMFPQISQSTNIPDDPSKTQNFKEPLIDSMRAERDDELDRLMKDIGQRRKFSTNMIL